MLGDATGVNLDVAFEAGVWKAGGSFKGLVQAQDV